LSRTSGVALDEQLFCEEPFRHFETLETGGVFLCCPQWLPTSVGNLHTESAEESWNSDRAQAIRRDILAGSFKYCDSEICPRIQSNSLPTVEEAKKNPYYKNIIENKITKLYRPTLINFSHDRSCNISCPSCRNKKISFSDGPQYLLRKQMHDKIVRTYFSQATDDVFTLNITGSGDPFGSKIFREFLRELDGSMFPNMRIDLQTNGVMFTQKMWDRMEKIHENITLVMVSFDAASEATYNITRRGGNWRQLLKNMEFLSQLRRTGQRKFLQFYFVVQKANFREMGEFVKIGKQFLVDQVCFSKANNWGTWTRSQFNNTCVWSPDHPDYEQYLRVLAQPILGNDMVMLGNLTRDRELALQVSPMQ